MIHTDPASAAPAIANELDQADSVLILSHISPDGDAIGSMLGLFHALSALGKRALPLASSELPANVRDLPGINEIHIYHEQTPLPPADLVWMVDTAEPARVGQIYDDHADELAHRRLVIVDHHVTNRGAGHVNLIDPTAASCAELLYELLHAMQLPLPPAAATCLLMGIVSDTQSFSTNSTNARSLRIAADLLAADADHANVVQQLYFAQPYANTQLLGLALSRMQRDGDLVWTSVTQAMLAETGASDDANDDVIQALQRIAGARIAVLFKERQPQQVKISLRSQPGINVAELAQTWQGGGHAQAAGATLHTDLSSAQDEVLARLRARLAEE
jgi:phosphoesterase RecJ-like protein